VQVVVALGSNFEMLSGSGMPLKFVAQESRTGFQGKTRMQKNTIGPDGEIFGAPKTTEIGQGLTL